MRYYPWIIRSRELARPSAAPPDSTVGLNALFPRHRGGPDPIAVQAGLDTGAQVGVKRNLEFTAGGRAHRLSTGPNTKA